MTTQFHHINLCAKDPSDLENFYKDVLELSESNAYTGNQKQIKNRGYGGRVAFRKLEHVLVEIFQIGGIFGAQVDVMKLCRHGWDP